MKTDLNIVQEWLNDSAGQWFLLDRSSYRDKTLIQIIEDERNILGIITLPDKTPIGLMAFLDYDQINHKAEMRKLIGEKIHREKGYAKEATTIWIQYGIRNLGLKKIYINTIENNIRNITLNKELGFHIEGLLRKEFLVMAALKLEPGRSFDPQQFFHFCEQQVSHGGMDRKWFPDFVRVVDDFEYTQTQKVLVRNLKQQHFDRRRLEQEPIYWRRRGDRIYRPFERADFDALRQEFVAAERADLLDR